MFRRICSSWPSCSESWCLARHPKASIATQGCSIASATPWILASTRVHQKIDAKRIAQLRRGQKRAPTSGEWTDICAWVHRLKRWGMTDLSSVKLGSSASHTASSEIAVVNGQKKRLTSMSCHSLSQEKSDQPLVFSVTRVSSALLMVLRGVQCLAPSKTVGLHQTSQVMRIWRGPLTDGNITVFPEAGATHMDLLSGATWSVLEHPQEVDVYQRQRQRRCIDLSGPVPAMLDTSPLPEMPGSSPSREPCSLVGGRQRTGK